VEFSVDLETIMPKPCWFVEASGFEPQPASTAALASAANAAHRNLILASPRHFFVGVAWSVGVMDEVSH
jgi:hypothetical protein